jgi:hypothetical protein
VLTLVTPHGHSAAGQVLRMRETMCRQRAHPLRGLSSMGGISPSWVICQNTPKPATGTRHPSWKRLDVIRQVVANHQLQNIVAKLN